MKKIGLSIVAIFCLTFILSGCGSKVSSGKYDIYKVKITKISTNDSGEWVIKGKTKAPNGAKLVALNKDDRSFKDENAAQSDDLNWSKVENGNFETYVDGSTLTDKVKAGTTINVNIFAITNYHKERENSIPNNVIKAYEQNFKSTKLTISSSQSKYLKSVDRDSKNLEQLLP